MNAISELSSFSEIRSIIRHGHSYRGGGNYGNFGGYDITLITLAEALHAHMACLPSPAFQDIGSGKLAGYGMFSRRDNKCLTNEYGRAKFHYCKSVGSLAHIQSLHQV